MSSKALCLSNCRGVRYKCKLMHFVFNNLSLEEVHEKFLCMCFYTVHKFRNQRMKADERANRLCRHTVLPRWWDLLKYKLIIHCLCTNHVFLRNWNVAFRLGGHNLLNSTRNLHVSRTCISFSMEETWVRLEIHGRNWLQCTIVEVGSGEGAA